MAAGDKGRALRTLLLESTTKTPREVTTSLTRRSGWRCACRWEQGVE